MDYWNIYKTMKEEFEKQFTRHCEEKGILPAVIAMLLLDVEDYVEDLNSSQAEEIEKQWLEKYGDLTKQFDEMVKWREEMERIYKEKYKNEER